MFHLRVGIVWLSTALLVSTSSAAMYETAVPPKDGARYKSAEFRIWIPDDVKKLRGVIVKQHGCGRRGLDHADDLQWQALARKHDCALLGSHFQDNGQCSDWFLPTNGSEKAFFQALETFAEQSKHSELTLLPWAIWGHSGGALWAHHMAIRHPERVVAVIARSQAVVEANEGALHVPIVFNYGVREMKGRFEKVHANSAESFALNRPQGALWSPAIDPKSEHDCRNSRHIAIPYFDAALAQRLPVGGGVKLRPMDLSQAWLANLETLEIFPESKYPGDKAKAGWLPNEAVAKAWQEFCKTGEVADKTPPPSPRNVIVAAKDGKAKLIWAADIDLESGIRAFIVYRDGNRIATVVGGPKMKAFQAGNYGDEPEPRLPAMEFVDLAPVAGARYEISAENHAGLESAKTPAK
jgi:pimeloyl-ACP methyl ester carboxylesterase